MIKQKSRLGKGLDAIFMENDVEPKNSTVMLRISEIEPNKKQPRMDFDDKSLIELADSISKHGILQPLLVRPIVGSDGYQIIAGERRWRACRMAGVKEVPVVIKDVNDLQVMQFALIENLQREDLTPIEEAKGYKSLIDEFNFTQDEVSKSVGKSRPAITNALRLLSLPEPVVDMVSKGEISAGHARALLAIEDKDDIIYVAEMIVKKGLSVRDVESLIKKNKDKTDSKKVSKRRPVFFDEVEISLKEQLGRKIKVNDKNENKGILEIEFYSQEDLADLARCLEKI